MGIKPGFSFLFIFLVFDQSKAVFNRQRRIVPLFEVIRFNNEPCIGSRLNGTCYTHSECEAKGGTNGGSCASGLGVCCTFVLTCGGESRENCTYIENTDPPQSGFCKHTICPCNDNICQLRLDFDMFVLAGPSTNSNAEVTILSGTRVPASTPSAVRASFASQCLTDTFSVTNTAGTNPGPICGINSGQHMYVDVDRSRGGMGCNNLDFQLGSSPVFTSIPARKWRIKVSQVECNSKSRAPSGCTQYYLGNEGTVQTYNFEGGQHLASQKQTICVRRNQGQCRICWSAVTPEDFAISGQPHTATPGKGWGATAGSRCCGFNDQNGRNDRGYDCVQIPGAITSGNMGQFVPNSRFCGRSVGLVKSGIRGNVVTMTTDPRGDITVCSTQTPFFIQFLSDEFESVDRTPAAQNEIAKLNKGFRLAYSQDSENCPT